MGILSWAKKVLVDSTKEVQGKEVLEQDVGYADHMMRRAHQAGERRLLGRLQRRISRKKASLANGCVIGSRKPTKRLLWKMSAG